MEPCGVPEIAFSVSAYDLRCQLILLLLSHVDKCCAQASERTTFFSTTTYDSIIWHVLDVRLLIGILFGSFQVQDAVGDDDCTRGPLAALLLTALLEIYRKS
jgi:hypothetical protein